MSFENRPGSGALFKSRDREKNPKAPNLRGDALLQLENGELVPIEISAWVKASEKAGRWLSLSVKPKATRQRFDAPSSGRARFNQRVQEMGTDMDAAFGPDPADDEE